MHSAEIFFGFLLNLFVDRKEEKVKYPGLGCLIRRTLCIRSTYLGLDYLSPSQSASALISWRFHLNAAPDCCEWRRNFLYLSGRDLKRVGG